MKRKKADEKEAFENKQEEAHAMSPKQWNVVIHYTALLAIAAMFLLPIAWVVSCSLKKPEQVFTETPQWIPNRRTIS